MLKKHPLDLAPIEEELVEVSKDDIENVNYKSMT